VFFTVSGLDVDHTIASAGEDQEVDAGAQVMLDASGSVSDADTRQTWEQISGPTVMLSSTTDLRPTFTAPELSIQSTLVFRVKVEEIRVSAPAIQRHSDEDFVTITVRPEEEHPPLPGGESKFVMRFDAGVPTLADVSGVSPLLRSVMSIPFDRWEKS